MPLLFLAKEEAAYLRLCWLLWGSNPEKRTQIPYEDISMGYPAEKGIRVSSEVSPIFLANSLKAFGAYVPSMRGELPPDIYYLDWDVHSGFIQGYGGPQYLLHFEMFYEYFVISEIQPDLKRKLYEQRLEQWKSDLERLDQVFPGENYGELLETFESEHSYDYLSNSYYSRNLRVFRDSSLQVEASEEGKSKDDTDPIEILLFGFISEGLFYKKLGEFNQAIDTLEAARRCQLSFQEKRLLPEIIGYYLPLHIEISSDLAGNFADQCDEWPYEEYVDSCLEMSKALVEDLPIPLMGKLTVEEIPSFHLSEVYLSLAKEAISESQNQKARRCLKKAYQYLEEASNFHNSMMLYGDLVIRETKPDGKEILEDIFGLMTRVRTQGSQEPIRNPYIERNLSILETLNTQLGDLININPKVQSTFNAETIRRLVADPYYTLKMKEFAVLEEKTSKSHRWFKDLDWFLQQFFIQSLQRKREKQHFEAVRIITYAFEGLIRISFAEVLLKLKKNFSKELETFEISHARPLTIGSFNLFIEKYFSSLALRLDMRTDEVKFSRELKRINHYRGKYHHYNMDSSFYLSEEPKKDWHALQKIIFEKSESKSVISYLLNLSRVLKEKCK